MRRPTLLSCLLAIGCSGCASQGGSHGAVHVAPDESRPHITWEIRSGGGSGDREFVCGSVQPATACVLPVSAAANETTATVHVYLHAAAQETNYLGVLGLPFLQGVGIEKSEVNLTVPRGSRPVGVTISDWTTSKPGSYTFRVQLDATQVKMPTPMRIVENIPVTVK